MAVIAIAQGRVTDQGLLDQYVEKAVPTIAAHGGRVVAFDAEPEVVEGALEHPRTVVLEFPSREAFHGWYQSPEYQEIVGLRIEAAPGTFLVANGFTPPE